MLSRWRLEQLRWQRLQRRLLHNLESYEGARLINNNTLFYSTFAVEAAYRSFGLSFVRYLYESKSFDAPGCRISLTKFVAKQTPPPRGFYTSSLMISSKFSILSSRLTTLIVCSMFAGDKGFTENVAHFLNFWPISSIPTGFLGSPLRISTCW